MSPYSLQVKQARQALLEAGLQDRAGVRDWFSPVADGLLEQDLITPFKVGIALMDSWDRYGPNGSLFHILTPLLEPRQWSDVVGVAAAVGPTWLFQKAWAESDDIGRMDALQYLACVGPVDHLAWLIATAEYAQGVWQSVLALSAARGSAVQVDLLLTKVEKPWLALRELRQLRGSAKGERLLDERWSALVEAGQAPLPPPRSWGSRSAASMPLVSALRRVRQLNRALPAATPSRSKPRF